MPAGCVGGIGGVPAATADSATSSKLVAADSCPATWPALRVGPPSGAFDGNVSVLVGGSLHVGGSAAGAEGTVVTLGDAIFARDVPGPYEVGVTALGSQVSPYAGSDMLVVGGNLDAAPGTHVDVGQVLGGDVVVGGASPTGPTWTPTAARSTPGSPTPPRRTSTSWASSPPSPSRTPSSRPPGASRSTTTRSP